MPVIADSSFPDFRNLAAQGLVCLPGSRAAQGQEPHEMAVFNSMPNKARTAADIVRLVGATGQPVNITFLRPRVMEPCEHDFIRALDRKPDAEARAWHHHFSQYKTLDEVAGKRFHSIVTTGAPLGERPLESLTYWGDWCEIFGQSRDRFGRVLAVCLSAMGAAKYFHGVEKQVLPEKLSGVYPQHVVAPHDPLVLGLGTAFTAPVSRFSTLPDAALNSAHVQVLAGNRTTGAGLLRLTPDVVGLTIHPEYKVDTLAAEYANAQKCYAAHPHGAAPRVPFNYFHHDDPAQGIKPASWGQAAHQLGINFVREARHAALEKGLVHVPQVQAAQTPVQPFYPALRQQLS